MKKESGKENHLESESRKGPRLGWATKGLLAAATLLFVGSLAYAEPYARVKAGTIIPTGGAQPYSPSLLVGAYLGYNIPKTGVGIEAGVDYWHSSAQYIETDSFQEGVNVTFSPLEIFAPNVAVKPYVSLGGNNLTENSAIKIPQYGVDDHQTSNTLGLNVGGGVTMFDNTVYVSVEDNIMPTSENVKNAVKVSGGINIHL